MNDEQINRLLSAVESIAGSLRTIAERTSNPPRYSVYGFLTKQMNPVSKEEASRSLGNISDRTLKSYCADVGADPAHLTVGAVESIEKAIAEKHQRPDVANRNKKERRAKYHGKEGYKERRK